LRRRTVAANSALALAGDAAAKGGALLVVLVAARLLSVAELASFATGLALASLLACALDLGASTLISRDGARDGTTRGALFRALLRARAPAATVAPASTRSANGSSPTPCSTTRTAAS
jgi:O-antigen/teichoic acid export membrane protein